MCVLFLYWEQGPAVRQPSNINLKLDILNVRKQFFQALDKYRPLNYIIFQESLLEVIK